MHQAMGLKLTGCLNNYEKQHIFGHIKANLGFRDFLLRRIKGAKIEFNLACIASNLRRIWSYLSGCEVKNGAVVC